MSYQSDGSPHSFQAGLIVADAGGRRGVVQEASALYAVVVWEDGVRQEIEQGEPTVWAVDFWEMVDEEKPYGGDPIDPTSDYQYDAWAIERSHDFWSAAGPRPEEKAHEVDAPSEQREAA